MLYTRSMNITFSSIIDFEKIVGFLGPFMLILFSVLFVIAVLGTVVLNYHWQKYGVQGASIKRVRKIYLGVSGALFLVMAGSVAAYYIL